MFDDMFDMRDQRRAFSNGQKRNIRASQGARCAHCGKQPRSNNTEYDHAMPHVYGGPTSEMNGQALCKSCHRRKTSAQNSKNPFSF